MKRKENPTKGQEGVESCIWVGAGGLVTKQLKNVKKMKDAKGEDKISVIRRQNRVPKMYD